MNKTKQLTTIGVMTAVICVLGPLSLPLPFSPVPLSFTNMAIFFTIYVLGMKRGTISYLIYLLIGLVGVPVFSSFTGGFGKLFGPTGGYLLGFVFMALISGFFIEHFSKRSIHFIGMVLGALVCNLFGTIWLSYQSSLSFKVAFAAGVTPFIPGDLAKIILVLIAGPILRNTLRKNGLVSS